MSRLNKAQWQALEAICRGHSHDSRSGNALMERGFVRRDDDTRFIATEAGFRALFDKWETRT